MIRRFIVLLVCICLIVGVLPHAALGSKPESKSYTVVVNADKAHRDVAVANEQFVRGNKVRFGESVATATGRFNLSLKASFDVINESLQISQATIRGASWIKDIAFGGTIQSATVDSQVVYWGRLDVELETDLGRETGVAAIYFNPKKHQDTVVNVTLGAIGEEHEMSVLLFGEPHSDIERAVNVDRMRVEAKGVEPSASEIDGDFQTMSVPPLIEANHVHTYLTYQCRTNTSKNDPPWWDIADGIITMTNIFERSPYTNGNGHGYVDVRVFTDTVAVQQYLGPNYDGSMPFVDTDEILFRVSSMYIGLTDYYRKAPSQKDYSLLGLIPTYGTYVQYFANTVSNLFASVIPTTLSSPGGLQMRLRNLIYNADFTYRDRYGNWIPKSRSQEATSGGAFVRLFYNEGSSGFRPITVETKVWFLASVNQSWIYVVTPNMSHTWNTNMSN